MEARERLREAELFLELKKANHVALGLTAEAVEELLGGVHDERSFGIVVPRAASGQVLTHLLQLDPIASHKLGEVYLSFELVEGVTVEIVH